MLSGLPVNQSHAEWGVSIPAEQAGGWPLDVGLRIDEGILRAQAYRTSQGVVGNGLFWLVCALSVLTSWMLIGTWRHTRRRSDDR